MKALPVAVEEARQEALAERLKQLDLAAPESAAESSASFLQVAAHQVLAAEGVAVERQRGLDRAHCDGDVVKLKLRHALDSSQSFVQRQPVSGSQPGLRTGPGQPI